MTSGQRQCVQFAVLPWGALDARSWGAADRMPPEELDAVLGTFLVQAAELRIRERGLRRSELAVEESNPRARALYERLG
ncbi:GNAT family N-acetyltransferase, partial [Streptomyces sp. BE308]|uniref:GNAT family N-acetyltransferase n=1 Tax=Streptomyces sp. BE308 TaxID=3002529 RepID=UPI002E78BEAA